MGQPAADEAPPVAGPTATPNGSRSGSSLGVAQPDAETVRHVARAATGRPLAEVDHWEATAQHGYSINSPITAGLFRVDGTAVDGGASARWSAFVKVVQTWRHWPLLPMMPPAMRDWARTEDDWRFEADLYRSGVPTALPPGLRVPQLYRLVELGDDRMALWMEDVRVADGLWDRARFTRAAHFLGRMTGRLAPVDLSLPEVRRVTLGARALWDSRVVPAFLPPLGEDATWAHPLIAGSDDPSLRTDLQLLAARAPAMLDALDQLPRLPCHGDACPQNLLVPADDPEGFVAIDWAMMGLGPVGADLAQLLVGLAHSGELDPDEVPGLAAALVDPFAAGLAEEGLEIPAETIRYGFEATAAVRSAFTALPLERLAEPVTDELAALFATRLRLTRALVDLGLALPAPTAR